MADAHGHGSGGLPGEATINKILHGSHDSGGMHFTNEQAGAAAIFMVVAIGIFFFIDPIQTVYNFEFLLFFSPIWAPLVLWKPTWTTFVNAKRAEFFTKQNWVLLEVLMPRDTMKTPAAMEAFFSNIHIGSGETNWYKKYIGGSTRPSWAFEIVSIGGRIHFYIWCRDGYRRLTESYLYAQYPEVQIIEAEDYSRVVDPTAHDWDMWGGEFSKKREDPIPIKTYFDYEMKPDTKPEETVDPLAQLIEYLGSLGPGEQFWIQFNIRMTKGEKFGNGKSWRDVATQVIKDLRTEKAVDSATGKELERLVPTMQMTKGQQDFIAAIERNVSKQGFDVGIRSIYCAPKDRYQGINVPAMLQMFKPFNNEANNQLNLLPIFLGMFGDYPWEDRKGHHKEHQKHELLNFYRQRLYFYPPYKGPWSIMSTEELATLYHVPSRAVTTPNLPRIQSATTSAPSNLPT